MKIVHMNKLFVNIKGHVLETASMSSNTKTDWLKFKVKTKDLGIFECVCFGELAKRYGDRLLIDTPIGVRGHHETEDDREFKKVIVKDIALNKPEPTEKDKLIKNFGSIEGYRKYLEDLDVYKTREGLVKAFELRDGQKAWRWYPKNRTVTHNGEVWTKIDYAMNVHGQELVIRTLRKLVKNLSGLLVKEGNFSRFQKINGYNEQVSEWVSEETEDYNFSYEDL